MQFHKIQAKLVLAVLFFLHLLKRIFFFWRKPRGLEFFLEQFAQDGIFPISPSERTLFPLLQKCQACSLCTFSCTSIIEGKAPSNFEPKLLLLGFGRSTHESENLFDDWLPCLECKSCQVLCPNDVPVHQMANQIIARRSHLKFRAKA